MTDKPTKPEKDEAHTELRRQTKGKSADKSPPAPQKRAPVKQPAESGKSDPLDDLFNDMPV